MKETKGGSTGWLTGRVMSWALYDLANTIFSMNIVSMYLALWVGNVMGGTDATWGYVNSFSMLLILLSAPVLGALSDQAGRRLPFLLAATVLCVGFTALLGSGGLWITLGFFVVANYFFQAGLIFYDATLPLVSTPSNRGRVGGFGIGIGYLGSFIGISFGLMFLDTKGHVFIFRSTALLFLAFAIPIFLFVKEPVRESRLKLQGIVSRSVRQVVDTVRHVRRYRGLGRFLIGRMFYADAANTVIYFLGLYVTNEIGFSDRQAQVLLLVAISAAVAGSTLLGYVVDRLRPKKTLDLVLALWFVALVLGAAIPLTPLPSGLFWGVGCLAGVALGGTWTADRPYMLVLAPPEKIGEFYGLYSLVGRFAAVVGPFLWAFVAETMGFGRPAALGSLLVMIVVAYFILRGVDDHPREWDQMAAGGD
jgi:UMF1 family MFS transporter